MDKSTITLTTSLVMIVLFVIAIISFCISFAEDNNAYLSIADVIKNIIYLPYKKIFGSGSGFGIFFTTFIAILTFVVGLLIYKTLRGNP